MGTLSDYLIQDHQRCDMLLRQTQQHVGAADWVDAGRAAAAFLGALERHVRIEEDIVFPAYERALGTEAMPTTAMRADHQRVRALAQRLASAIEARSAHDFVAHAESLLLTMHLHSEKEEGVLYPVIERVLAQRSAELIEAARALDADPGAGSASTGAI